MELHLSAALSNKRFAGVPVRWLGHVAIKVLGEILKQQLKL